MSDKVYRVTKIVGTLDREYRGCNQKAVSRANETLNHLDWLRLSRLAGISKMAR